MSGMVLGRRDNRLPPDWLLKPFGELVTHSQNGISKRRSTIGNPKPVLRLADIREGQIDESAPREIKLSDEEFSKYALRDGDLLCIRVNGSRSLTGRLVYFRSSKGWAYCDHFIRFRLKPEIPDSKYLAHYFDTQMVRDYLGKHMVSTAGQNTLSQGTMFGVAVPVAPADEQRAIVAEIEKQFSRLDEAVASLKRTKANLKRYKAAVLKAAVEGKLTEDWRKQHPDVEPAGKLLERILAERRSKWAGRGKYKEPEAADANGLPPLPKGWTWARLEQLGITFGGLTKNPQRARFSKKLPYLRVANVYANELRLDEIEYIGVQDSELDKLLLRKGDLLVVEGNGSKDQIGRLAIWNGSIDPCVHQNHLIKVRLVVGLMNKWILFWLLSPMGRHFIEQVSSSTSGLYTLSVNKVGDLPIVVPPLSEQNQIVAEVERRLSVIDELEATVEANLTRADRLRQSVLSHAFSGQLVTTKNECFS